MKKPNKLGSKHNIPKNKYYNYKNIKTHIPQNMVKSIYFSQIDASQYANIGQICAVKYL